MAPASAVTVCSANPELLAKHEGVYVSSQFVDTVRKTRRWDQARPDGAGLTEIRISQYGRVELSAGWHEAVSLGKDAEHGCLELNGKELRLRQPQFKQAGAYEKLEGSYRGLSQDAPYFDLLFNGCFVDQDLQRWCFKTNSIEIGGQARLATLLMDASELPTGGTALQVAGSPDFWLFVPKGAGWSVYRSTWASSPTFVEPLSRPPWKVLTPSD